MQSQKFKATSWYEEDISVNGHSVSKLDRQSWKYFLGCEDLSPHTHGFDVPSRECDKVSRPQPCVLAGSEHSTHRRESLKLVMATASAVLSLRSPLDSALPGRSIDKFTAMLFGGEVSHPPSKFP